ncbi:MAG: hypothetical protein JWP27_1911 [Flaviaesturariibacter sp.]|nr:hypothetical protein [Flaviaesturariibacter sp.]
MKRFFVPLSLALLLTSGLSLTSCKDKSKDKSTTTTTTTPETTTTAPVEVSGDAALQQGATDATKDFPGVTTSVANGEVNVSGEIRRADWQTLKPRLDALNPKKVTSNGLTIK